MRARSFAWRVEAAAALVAAVLFPVAVGASEEVSLLFDHRTGTWATDPPVATEVGAGWPGVPTVYLRQGQKLRLHIDDTNPLLYAVASVSVKEEDTQLLKSLQDLASLLGKAAAAALRPGAGGKGGVADPLLSDIVAAVEHIESSAKVVNRGLVTLATAKANAVALLQRADFAQLAPAEYTSSIWGEQPVPPTAPINEATASFSRLLSAREDLESLDYRCMLPVLRELVAARVFGDAGNRDLDDLAKVRLKAALWAQLAGKELVGCGAAVTVEPEVERAQARLDELAKAFSALGGRLASVADATAVLEEAQRGGSGRDAVGAARRKLADAQAELTISRAAAVAKCADVDAVRSKALLELADDRAGVVTAADALLARSDEARKAAANLVAFDMRRAAAAKAHWQVVVPTPVTGARWDKVQEYTVAVKADSPYAGNIARNPELQDVTLVYDVRWEGESVLGVGVGVTFTPLEDHTWAALPLSGDPTRKSPQPKTTETRAGQLALFLNWRVVQTFWPAARRWVAKPGLEIGASLNTDKPGAYLGLSVEVLKVLRIAGGRTWQRVTVLDGQVEGVTVVESDADIRTRQAFRPSWYASLTFALDSLALFKKE
jgi:hypothetical protein